MLIGIVIFIFDKISYVFEPFIIIFNTIVAPIILSLILFYLINPVINLMERYNIPRLLGIIIVFLAIVGGATLIINLLIPLIGDQITRLANNFPKYVDIFNNAIDQVTHFSFLSSFYTQIQDWLDSVSNKIPSMVSSYFDGFGTKIRSFAEVIVNVGVVLVTTPFVLFFMLKDGHKFKEYSTKIMPPKFRKDYHDLMENECTSWIIYPRSNYCFILYWYLTFIGYSIIGLDYGLVLACIVAATSVVPYLGPTIAISPPSS